MYADNSHFVKDKNSLTNPRSSPKKDEIAIKLIIIISVINIIQNGLTNNIKDLGITSVEHINSILKFINLQRLNNNPISLDKNIVYRILMEKLDKN